MRIFDCFTFFDEMEILEARVEELYGEVTHVLVEAHQTHRGDPKGLVFTDHRRKFKKYPIIHCAASLPAGEGPECNWDRENAQRDEIAALLEHVAEDDDLIILTDCDEIPSREALPRIAEMSSEGPVRLAMPLWYYSLAWEVARDGKTVIWTHGIAFRWRDRYAPFSKMRLDHGGITRTVPDAGWHFAWFGNHYSRVRKLQSFAHAELDNNVNRGLLRDWRDDAPEWHYHGEQLDALGSPLKRSTSSISPTVRNILSTRRRWG